MKFEIRSSASAQPWYWVILASNGRVLAKSETYYNRADAVSAANSVRNQAPGTPTVY